MNRLAVVLVALATFVACSSPDPELTTFNLTLPLSLTQADYRHARVTQLGHTRDFVLDTDGRVAATVVAGVPVTIEVMALGVENDTTTPAIALYTGTSTVIPMIGRAHV